MLSRRQFMKSAGAGLIGLGGLQPSLSSQERKTGYFALHPFIEKHPEAVFIMLTDVDHKMNAGAKRQAGLDFGKSVFVPGGKNGIPVTSTIPVKMNLKTTGAGRYPLQDIIGTVTDHYFAEGTFEALKALGVPGHRIRLRENPRGTGTFEYYGIVDMANRTGIDFRQDLRGTVTENLVEGRDFNWHDVPDGKWFKQLPQLEPINQPDTWLLNIAKFKAHGMGLTLCSKNLQGMVVRPFTRFCSAADSDMTVPDFIRHDAIATIANDYRRHRDDNRIPRWDRPGSNGGIWQEVWSQRTLDHLSITPCGLNIIEGIYGRDGMSGNSGPHTQNADKIQAETGIPPVTAKDFMHNMIIFGKDIFRTDIIGHWLGGHEPGNFGYFHLALERGMSDVLDPRKIPVYIWDNGSATLTKLESFKRTPLQTYYLQKDYGKHTESNYHLCDEPFDYGSVDGIGKLLPQEKPDVDILRAETGDHGRFTVSLEYSLPVSGPIRLEILNGRGDIIGVPSSGYRSTGCHMATWESWRPQAESCAYRLKFRGHEVTGMIA